MTIKSPGEPVTGVRDEILGSGFVLKLNIIENAMIIARKRKPVIQRSTGNFLKK